MIKRIPGTKDILPGEVSSWQSVEKISQEIFAVYNYSEIRPPLIEEASLFNRSLGEATEIVQKQMFLIKNQDDLYALRPEATASIARAYIENNIYKNKKFFKVYYLGPMFRLERPQKGRLRQFHHIGAEAIGSRDAFLDVEIISLAKDLLEGLGISDYSISLNSLGCEKDKKNLIQFLEKELEHKKKTLCEDCRIRFDKNILRILDCKNENCINIIRKLGLNKTNLCRDCDSHFADVVHGLEELNIKFELAPLLVRGLDYYTGTVFEISHKDLGAQDALGAGGRYDKLISALGGPDTPAIGFAFGVERLLLLRPKALQDVPKTLVYLITLGRQAKKQGLKLLQKMRKENIACDADYEDRSIKGAMRIANDLGANYVIIIGDNELENGAVMLKDMASSKQEEVKIEGLISHLKSHLTHRP